MPAIVSRGIFCAHGRLTLTTATPVLASDVTSAGTVYYSPYIGDLVSVYSGSEFLTYAFSELSCLLSDATKSPAAAVADSLYDLFVWNDVGTLRLSRGPVWTDATTRSAGTALVRTKGVLLNNVSITNGPAASRGTYVGTIATNSGAATLNMMFLPNAAAGGSDNFLGVWNAYNRCMMVSVLRDSTDSWSYTTAAFQQANASTANKITFVAGLAESGFVVETQQSSSNSSGSIMRTAGIGLDAVNAMASGCLPARGTAPGNEVLQLSARLAKMHAIGRHYVAPLEYSVATGTTTWHGDGGGASIIQNGMTLELEM